MNLTW